ERYVAHGIGMGFQPPVVGTYLGEAVEERYELKRDMVLVLEPYTWRDGVGGFQAKQMVHITADGPEVWGQFPMGPLAGEDRVVQFPVAI
ncbi:MAG: M24 family metallopeptidase, partial [Dehalococcoidia bacterium]